MPKIRKTGHKNVLKKKTKDRGCTFSESVWVFLVTKTKTKTPRKQQKTTRKQCKNLGKQVKKLFQAEDKIQGLQIQ